MNLDLSKALGADDIPVLLLKNCEPELSYIIAELFNKSLKGVLFSRLSKSLISGPCI